MTRIVTDAGDINLDRAASVDLLFDSPKTVKGPPGTNCEDLLREKFALRRPESLAFTEWLNLFEDYLQNEKMNPAKALINDNKKIIN